MDNGISLNLPEGWKSRVETVRGEFGTPQNHAWARSADGSIEIDVNEGEMPQDSTAQDQALTNYVDMVGFDDDDPEDYNPIEQWTFNNRKAYGFQVYCEGDSQLRVLCFEHKRGRLAVCSVEAPDEKSLDSAVMLLERSLRFHS